MPYCTSIDAGMHVVKGVNLFQPTGGPRQPPEMVACPLFVYCPWVQAARKAPEVINQTKTEDQLLFSELVPGRDLEESRLSPLAAAAFRGNTTLFDEVIKICKDKDEGWDPIKVRRDH